MRTQVRYDVPERVLVRGGWETHRFANEIGRTADKDMGGHTGVELLASDAWQLASFQVTNVTETDDSVRGVIRLLSMVAVGTIYELAHRKAGTDLPGVTYDPGVTATGDYFLTKRVAAGAGAGVNFAAELTADVTALPKPTLPTANNPMRRIATGLTTFKANRGFGFRFIVPGTKMSGPDSIATFYFGGGWDPKGYGSYCCSFFGDGTARLHELQAGDWVRVFDFQFSDPARVAEHAHNVVFEPHGRDRMDISCQTATGVSAYNTRVPRYAAPPGSQHVSTYRVTKAVSGHHPGPTVTGQGTIRLDVREDQRLFFQMSALAYNLIGTLFDQPVFIPRNLPAGTKIYLRALTDQPTGTSITATLRDAKTLTALTSTTSTLPNALAFESVAGQHFYRADFVFNGPADRSTTPRLYWYEVFIERLTEDRSPTYFTGGHLRSLSITGPDLDPTHESCALEVQDAKNELGTLRHRGLIHTKVMNLYDDGVTTWESVLFEGEIAEAPAVKWGKPGAKAGAGTGSSINRAYPRGHRYDLSFVSMWARVQKQLLAGGRDYRVDHEHPENGPYKITDILTFLFEEAGIDRADLDIPDLPIRAWPGQGGGNEWIIPPATPILDKILELTRQYLGWAVVYDANAGTRGMWRLIKPVPLSADPIPLWTFQTMHPGVGKEPLNPKSYGDRTTFIRHFSPKFKAPEANCVFVSASGDVIPDQKGEFLVGQVLCNYDSYNVRGPDDPTADPSHPDYIGYEIPLIYVDQSLGAVTVTPDTPADDPTHAAQKVVNLLCRRLFDQVAHAQKWVHFTAPLVMLPIDATDPNSTAPRPLRVYDPINIVTAQGTFSALVRSVQMGDGGRWIDRRQTMDVQALILDNTADI